jgi:hypothetical protein
MKSIENWGLQNVLGGSTYLTGAEGFSVPLDRKNIRPSKLGGHVDVKNGAVWEPYNIGAFDRDFFDPYEEYTRVKNNADPNGWLLAGVDQISPPPGFVGRIMDRAKELGATLLGRDTDTASPAKSAPATPAGEHTSPRGRNMPAP